MTRVTQISKEEIEPVVAARGKVMESAAAAEKALKDAKLAELEFKVQIQQLYLSKGLDQNCRVDISTGMVSWPDQAQQTPAPEVEDPPKKKRGRKPAVQVEEVVDDTPAEPTEGEG